MSESKCPECGMEVDERIGRAIIYSCGSSGYSKGEGFVQSATCKTIQSLQAKVKELEGELGPLKYAMGTLIEWCDISANHRPDGWEVVEKVVNHYLASAKQKHQERSKVE